MTVTTEARELTAFAPGRTEIAGNHTDHEGGHVIAAAIDAGITARATPRDDDVVRVVSEGFDTVEIDLAKSGALDARPDERVTTISLVRGMLAELRAAGVDVHGFDANLTSTLPAGGGLSSSASFELVIGVIVRDMFASGDGVEDSPELGATALARMAQRTECGYFGKPCGLMDQLAVAHGGILAMDLSDADAPRIASIDFDFEAAGLRVCLVDVGCDHSRFTDAYAAVPREMQAVAHLFGARQLCEVSEAEVLAHVVDIRRVLGDRALLRALHFYREERLTQARSRALIAGDVGRFLRATHESGSSSAEWLQNVYAPGVDEPAMVAIALAQRVLGGHGAVRIHGGGFGGSIQAFVPTDLLDDFVRLMEGWLGKGCCHVLTVGGRGAESEWN